MEYRWCSKSVVVEISMKFYCASKQQDVNCLIVVAKYPPKKKKKKKKKSSREGAVNYRTLPQSPLHAHLMFSLSYSSQSPA